MATEIQEAFEKSIAELGFESLLDDAEVSPEAVEDQEQFEESEAETLEDESVEGDADSGDDDEAIDDDDEDATESPIIEIVQDAKLKLPDGTLVDAEQAVLLQADYTRKTQELAEQRKSLESYQQQVEQAGAQYQQAYTQMRSWYEERAARPADWLTEIASQTQDPTATVAQAIYAMAQNGLLDPQFVETFGIESGPVAQVAKGSQVESELEELKRWRYEQEMSAQRQAQVQQRAAVYEQEWESIKASKSIAFSDRAQELEAKRELLQFALENNLTKSLTDAYDLMTVRKPKSVKPQPSAEVTAKKRASRAVSSKSESTGKPVKKVLTDRDAILATLEEQGL
jgi:hypothetical protein